MDPHSRAPKKNTSYGNEVLPQDTTHLIQKPDDRKETQTAVLWSCFPFIRSGQNNPARHSERGKKTSRQRKRWEDNIREWTVLEFTKSQRAVEKKEKWRKLVVKSSVVPQQPLRLRDILALNHHLSVKLWRVLPHGQCQSVCTSESPACKLLAYVPVKRVACVKILVKQFQDNFLILD